MRIFLFPKLIFTEETKICSLRNCSVVIDGDNYLYEMYEDSKIPFVFGCETDKYAAYVRDQFNMFKKANVKCYIVFKGGDTDMEKKIKKIKHINFDFDTNFVFVPPVLLHDANAQVVDEMGVDYSFCITECKDECVALAQKLQCPVISNNIDYCFRKAPYIPWLKMKYNSETNSIQCRQFNLQNFLRKYSLTEEKFAIFATLTDVTVFPDNYFDALFQTWRVSNTEQRIRLKNLITWLSKHSEEETRQAITTTLSNEDDRDKFWSNYSSVLTTMRKEEVGHATEYLLNRNVSIVRQDPEWFEKGVVCKHVPPVYINLYKSKVIEGLWHILDMQSEDSLPLPIDIVKYAYNLLTNYKRDIIKLYQDANTCIEIDTDDPNIRRPRYECSVSVFENGWNEVKHLKLFEHFLAENNIDIEVLADAELPEDSVVFLIALVYFARKKQLKGEDVTNEVYAVVLSYIVLNVTLYTGVSSKDLVNVKQVTNKYYQYEEAEAKRIFDDTVSNRFVELQYCIQHMNYLNVLCGSSFKSSKYSRIYNGTFIFKIFRDMRGHNCDDFVNDLFKSTPRVLKVFKRLIKVYCELLKF